MVDLHVFSRRTGFLLFKDYALGMAFVRTAGVSEKEAQEQDYTASRIGLYNFLDKHKGRCKDVFVVINDTQDALPYVQGLLRRLFAEEELAKRMARLNWKVECPKMDRAAEQALAERIRERRL